MSNNTRVVILEDGTEGVFAVRGLNKGKRAKPTKCSKCEGEIMVGEQYIRIDDFVRICLGCAKYQDEQEQGYGDLL